MALANAFPPGARYTTLTYDHHRIAMRAARHFPADTPAHEPTFWLDQAAAQGWHRPQMLFAVKHYVSPEDTVSSRQAQMVLHVSDADRARTRIVAQLEDFNARHAIYWGSRLVLVEQPILAPAS